MKAPKAAEVQPGLILIKVKGHTRLEKNGQCDSIFLSRNGGHVSGFLPAVCNQRERKRKKQRVDSGNETKRRVRNVALLKTKTTIKEEKKTLRVS